MMGAKKIEEVNRIDGVSGSSPVDSGCGSNPTQEAGPTPQVSIHRNGTQDTFRPWHSAPDGWTWAEWVAFLAGDDY